MSDLIRWIADSLGYVPREEMETRMADLDQEMRDRLNVASSKAANKLREVQARLVESERRVGELEGAAAADSSSDAEALRPIVEFLEGLGADPSDPVPAVDPVPEDTTPVPGVETDGNTTGEAPTDVAAEPEVPAAGGTVEQPGAETDAETDAPVDPGTGEVQGGSAV